MMTKNTTDISTGEYLVKLLEAYGIEIIFGIPGVHTVELYRGLPDTNLTHITPRHEQGAGFMADGYARASGKPAACFIISGPGMTNILTAMAQAYSDSVPMLVISSVNNSHELALGQGRLHELPNQRQIVKGVTVFNHTLSRSDELPEIIARAFSVFNSARPGPVHIEIPLDVIKSPAISNQLIVSQAKYCPGPDPVAIKSAAQLISSAVNPFVVLGGGTQDSSKQALQLVDAIGAPAALTINAKGVLPMSHPLNLGSRLPLSPVLEAMIDADVVLAIGTELGETDTLLFDQSLNLKGKLIRIDIDAEQLNRNSLADIAICSDAGHAMSALTSALINSKPKQSSDKVKMLRSAADLTVLSEYKKHGKFLECVLAALPGVIVAGDSTQPVYGGNLTYDGDTPRSYFNSSTGYGTLGFGLPAALGAKIACPHRPVVSLIGDGGLQFTIAELASAVELKLAVPIIVWNNNGYGEIKQYMQERNIPTIGVDIFTPDFLTIAKGFGCKTASPGSYAELSQELKIANDADLPTLILIDESDFNQWK